MGSAVSRGVRRHAGPSVPIADIMATQPSVDHAVALAERILSHDPQAAFAQAEAILSLSPTNRRALLLRARASAGMGDLPAACATLAALTLAAPDCAAAHLELGCLLARKGEVFAAIDALRQAVTLDPASPRGWNELANQLTLVGDASSAEAAFARYLRCAVHHPDVQQAGQALVAGNLPGAAAYLTAHLEAVPTDLAALRMLAEVECRRKRYAVAASLLRRVLAVAPGFAAARYSLALTLVRQHLVIEALPEIEHAASAQPHDPNILALLADCLAALGRFDDALALYAGLVSHAPGVPHLLVVQAHLLRAVGRADQAKSAYRRALAISPATSASWWGLANLKTSALTGADLATIRAELDRPALGAEDRVALLYSMGTILEEKNEVEAAFAAYRAGAICHRRRISYSAEATSTQIDRTIRLLTPEFFAARCGQGCQDPSPIFIIGLPRAGSTLIEQMLSCHDAIEGTMELPELITVARNLGPSTDYPDILGSLSPDQLNDLGQAYLARARHYRGTEKPFFIDKLPGNWVHVGLIHLILPNAKIIDARRHPMATGFSCYKQLFARGHHYSYDLTELGLYIRDYIRLMDHFEAVLPGLVHRMNHEALVAHPESELRQWLAVCGLAFQGACLRFHDNPRSVSTASSEQVRRPIFRAHLDHWKTFSSHLGPLAEALGPQAPSLA